MDTVSTTTFWSGMSILGGAVGASFLLSVSHSSEPKHPDAARESDVKKIEIKLERVATDVEYSKEILGDLKEDIVNLRAEQTQANIEILEAIRNGH